MRQPIPEMTLKEWRDIAGLLNANFALSDPLFNVQRIFRGHEVASWKLVPSLYRAVTNDGHGSSPRPPDANELIKKEESLWSTFRAIASTQLPSSTVAAANADESRRVWWSVMRHYGVPTRILDWTYSFYVALYFAVSKGPGTDGAVYSLDFGALESTMKSIHRTVEFSRDQLFDPAAPRIIDIYSPEDSWPDRMIAQQACCMICRNVAGDIEEIFESEVFHNQPVRHVTLVKILIPKDKKPEFMRHLNAMNITAATLFPGLDGIGRFLDEKTRHSFRPWRGPV